VPEGDTIHRTATRLREVLAGRQVTRFDAPRTPPPHPKAGEIVEQVAAKGKHLLVGFSGGLTLQTHMGMTGSWHLYREGERWRRPAHLARCRIAVDSGWEAVCFSAPTVRSFVEGEGRSTPVDHLGPDLCEEDVDFDAAMARMATIPAPGTTIAEVLLDQRVAAGIGNAHKSEALWACRVDPFAAIETVDDETRRALLETAHRNLRASLSRNVRETIPGGVAAYGRARQPCPRCGTPIRVRRHGEQMRSTYWCPTCQVG